VRRRLRRQREGRALARHHREGAHRPPEPDPSRRVRLRPAHRRRGRHPRAGARCVSAPRVRRRAHRAPGARHLRRRHGLPARGGGAGEGVRRAAREGRRRGRPGAPRLAARAGRRPGARPARAHRAARGPAGLHRRRGRRRRPGCARAEALRDPQARRADRAHLGHAALGALLRSEPFLAHHRLQGPPPAAADPGLLPRPLRLALRLGAGARPPALLDQHLPVLGPRAPLPLHRAQRRDQHAARQRELDARAPGALRLAALRRRAEALPGHRPDHQRLGQVRQRARAPPAHGPLDRPRRHDDDPRGVAEPREHERGEAGLLRVPRLPAGAVGRPGVDRLHRWAGHRRRPRPQRPSAVALPRTASW